MDRFFWARNSVRRYKKAISLPNCPVIVSERKFTFFQKYFFFGNKWRLSLKILTKYKVKWVLLGQNEKSDLYFDNSNKLLLLIDISRYDNKVDLLALLTVITIYCHQNPFK